MTRTAVPLVIFVQASVLALIGLVFGVPLGLALGRTVWRAVADYTPLQYVPPLAVTALLAVFPLALVLANVLAAWPGHRATRLRVADHPAGPSDGPGGVPRHACGRGWRRPRCPDLGYAGRCSSSST